jgi:ubiquinone/menaquinone biosynthesis C-methylase UbiE
MTSSKSFKNFAFEDKKTVELANILLKYNIIKPARVLVVGCGSGKEAAVIARHLGTKVIGIDIVSNFDEEASKVAHLQEGDATCMEFDDSSFDFVYSFHALEHIPNYRAALCEIRRVLKPGGGYLIGTPNRTRLIGYLGSRQATISDKIRWNLMDWLAKIRGRFRNELGAHAGYSLEELNRELMQVFTTVIDVTPEYYIRIYSSQKFLVSALLKTKIYRWVFPAIYFYGVR